MKRTVLSIMLLLSLASCSNWLDVRPYDAISEQDLVSSADGFKQMLNGIYVELCSEELYGGALSVEMIEVMADSYEIGSDSNVWGDYVDLSKGDYGTAYWRERIDATWNKAYNLILNCNKILSLIDSCADLFSGVDFQIVKGEALALRAMLHFDLLRLFGPVFSRDPHSVSIPYYTSVTLQPNSRLDASDALDAVKADLEEARRLLECDPIRTEGVFFSAAPDGDNFLRYRQLRLNYFAVAGLLARTALWEGSRDEALLYAKEVIAASDIFPFVQKADVVGAEDPDRIFSSEVLFSLTTSNRSEIYLNYFSPQRTSFIFRMPSAYNSNVIFGGGQATGGYQDDYRNRACWLSSGSNRYFCKYAPMVASSDVRDTMVPLLRLGEMYLIAAECEGVQWYNALRRSRGLGTAAESLDATLLEYEYVRELYAEGQLFFFRKRTDSSGDDSKYVLPLPDSEKFN